MKKVMVILRLAVFAGALWALPAPFMHAASFSDIINSHACDGGNTLAGCKDSTKAQCAQAVDKAKCEAAANNLGSGSGYLAFLVDSVIFVGTILAVIFLLIGAIRYIASTGDAGRVKSAKDTILYSIIGLVVMIVARAIVGFLIHGVQP